MTAGVLMLALVQLGHPTRRPGDLVRARILSASIIRVAADNGLDPVLFAAQGAHESDFQEGTIGKRGERGIWQIMPTSQALAHHRHLTPDALARTPINAAMAAGYLARMRDLCARRGIKSPAAYLNAYNGGGCRTAGRYGREIVAAAARAREVIQAAAERGPVCGIGTAPARAPEVAAR